VIARMVVGTDGSPGGRLALRWATELAGVTGAHLIAVHAFQPLDHIEELKPTVGFDDLEAAALRTLRDDWCALCAAAGVSYEAVVREGEPADVMLDMAEDFEADLIVVGSRRLGSVKRLMLGSTSNKIVHESTRPVVIVPLLAELNG
jgi:nucleotide-binding universal stress UspA family protein